MPQARRLLSRASLKEAAATSTMYLTNTLASVPDTLLSSHIPISDLYTLHPSTSERFAAFEFTQQLRLANFALLSSCTDLKEC